MRVSMGLPPRTARALSAPKRVLPPPAITKPAIRFDCEVLSIVGLAFSRELCRGFVRESGVKPPHSKCLRAGCGAVGESLYGFIRWVHLLPGIRGRGGGCLVRVIFPGGFGGAGRWWRRCGRRSSGGRPAA